MIVMIAVMSAMFLVALDQTIISTSLGRIVEEFQSYSSLSWVVTAYLLTSTIMLPIGGKLSDLFGRRLMLIIGVLIFTIGSLASGSAQSIEQLILFRALQGIGGGIITSNAFTIVGDLFSPRERGKWQGIIGAVFGIAAVLGPLLGGFLTDPHSVFSLVTDWRWTLWLNVPIGIAALVMIVLYCPQIRRPSRPRVDYLGGALLILALTTIILAAENTDTLFGDLMITMGLDESGMRLLLAAFATVFIAAFVWAEGRADEPILPLRFFKNRTFSLMMIIALLNGAAFIGSILYLTQFNQQVFGATATQAGLMLLPLVFGLVISSAGGGQIVSRTGKYKKWLILGFVIATVSIMSLTTLSATSPYWQEGIIMFFTGLGLGFGLPVISLAVQNEFKQKDLGAATSSSQLFRSLGSTVGVAILGTVLTTGLTSSLGDVSRYDYVRSLEAQPSARAFGELDADTLLTLNMKDTQDKILTAANKTIDQKNISQEQSTVIKAQLREQQAEFSSIVKTAFVDSLRTVFILASVLISSATILAFFIKEKPLRTNNDDAPGVA
ncbi:MAG TPA: MDR family MFS transporter [Candidatus Nitrosotenuis sp.]|nr:MDR family MFS transporter [Candidatus Nitrosotenuis sp.]